MKTCDTVRSTLNAWADGEHRRSDHTPLAMVRHLLSCRTCRSAFGSLRSQRAALHTLPAPAPPSHARAAVLNAVAEMPAPAQSVQNPVRRRTFLVLAPITGAAVVALLLLGPWSQRELRAEDVARAMERVNTWRFKGWKLIQGKRVPWEISGRKHPFFYRERLGDSIVLDDGRMRAQVIPPVPNWRTKGLVLRTPSRPGSENMGWTYEAQFRNWQEDRRFDSETADEVIFNFNSGGMEGFGTSSDYLYTVDKRTALPVKYEVVRHAKGSVTQAESLEMEYDPRDFAADASMALPKSYLEVNSLARPKVPPTPRSVLDTRNGMTVQATPLAMDRHANLLVRLRGWLGDVPLGKHWELQWNTGGSALDMAGTDASWQIRDERGRLYVEAQFQSARFAAKDPSEELKVFAPVEPLGKGEPLPKSLRLGLRAFAQTMQPTSGANNMMEPKRLVQEEMSWLLPLPAPTSSARVIGPLRLGEARGIKGVERESLASAAAYGRAWYHGRLRNMRDHSPNEEARVRRSLFWMHHYVNAMEETSALALLRRLDMARDYRWLGEAERGAALAREVIVISDRHPKVWRYYRQRAEEFLKEGQAGK